MSRGNRLRAGRDRGERGAQAEFIQDLQAVRAQVQAGADFAQGGSLLEQSDREATPAERECRAQAADTGTDDGDVE